MQTLRTSIVTLANCVIMLGAFGMMEAGAQNIKPPAANIGDTKLHELYTNGLDPKAGTESTLGPTKTDTWQVVFTNTGNQSWTDFHVTIRADTPINQFNMQFTDVNVASGFGAPKAISFKISNDKKSADLSANMIKAVVPKGQTITLNIEARNASGFLTNVYHLGVMASTPEPSSLLLLLAGIIPIAGLRRWKK